MFTLLAVFFPAVMGTVTGPSGELRDPGRDLPRGTFLSLLLASVVFFALILLLAASVERCASAVLHRRGRGMANLTVLQDHARR